MLWAGLCGGSSLAVGGKTLWGSPTPGDLAANLADRLSGDTLGGRTTLGAWPGDTGRDNGGAFSGNLFFLIFAIRHETIKPFLVTLVTSCRERYWRPGGGIVRIRGKLYSLSDMQQFNRF